MPEELALHQGGWDPAAVDRHQRATAAGEPVDGAGEHLLARSALPHDQHRHPAGSDPGGALQDQAERGRERRQWPDAPLGAVAIANRRSLARNVLAEAQERVSQLKERAVVELGLLHPPAIDERSVLRAEVAEGPPSLGVAKHHLLRGHPPVRNLHREHPGGDRACAATGASSDGDLLESREAPACRAGQGALALDFQEEVRPSRDLPGWGLDLGQSLALASHGATITDARTVDTRFPVPCHGASVGDPEDEMPRGFRLEALQLPVRTDRIPERQHLPERDRESIAVDPPGQNAQAIRGDVHPE